MVPHVWCHMYGDTCIVRWTFDSRRLSNLDVYCWTDWYNFRAEDCVLQWNGWCGRLQCYCDLLRRSTVPSIMDTPGFGSPIHTYQANSRRMHASHDRDGSNATHLNSLGVVDLDLVAVTGRFRPAGF